MNTSIWKRLNTTLAISTFSLLIASGLAWLIVHTFSRSQHVSDRLKVESIRIRYDAVVISDSLRAMMLDPRDTRVGQIERKRISEAVKDFKSAIEELQRDFGADERIAPSLKSLAEFLPFTLDLHIAKTLEQIENDPIGARDSFIKIHPAIAEQRDKLVSTLIGQFDQVRKEGDVRSQTIAGAGSVGMVIVLILSWRAIRSASAAVTIPLKQLVDVIERMRNGDFTQRVEIKRKDEFGLLGDGLNRLADDLSVLVGQVQRSGVQVNITATQIAATSREQQSTTTEIAATTAEIGATSKQISATSRELDKTMNEVVDVAHDTAELAGSGQTGIARMESTMRQIMDASGSITGKLAVLNEKTANINTVVVTITKVADQTNLLSLNAAIEAEKAGEYGLGFAVVAMEIRRLADQTAVATYDIEKMVKEMQSAVAAGVMGMDKFSEEVRRGVDEIRQVSTQLAQIIHQVQTLTPRFATVSEGMHAQATGALQISETLTQLSEAAHQTADSLRQSNLAIEQLNEAARGLQTSVARFKLEAK
jgi:methyl-accepting chemotaxis protein WspA